MKMYRPSARMAAIVSGLMIGGCALLWDAHAGAQSEEGRCSNHTLRGDYGFAIDGQILAGPFAGLLRGVAMTHFDGRGNLDQVDFATLNGVPRWTGWRPVTGTYEVNPDCTGAAVLHTPLNPEVKLHFVVVRHGTEIHQVVDADAVTAIGIKVK